MTILLLGLLIGFLLGTARGAKTLRRTYPTTQEKIDAAYAASDPATAEDLMRLMAKRCVLGSGQTFCLGVRIGPIYIETPKREHLALVLADVPSFVRAVEAAETAYPPVPGETAPQP